MIHLLIASAFAYDPAAPAVNVGHGTVDVDGDLSDAAWATVEPITDFLRFQPTEDGPPPGTTEVRFLHDDKTLYVSVKIRDAIEPIRGRMSPREDIDDDDQIGLYLDPYGDANSGFIFYFNAIGIAQDIRYEGGGFEGWNFAWDTVVFSQGRVVDHGYDLEIGIPFRSLKFPDHDGSQTWGVIVTRKIPGNNEKYGFPKLARTAARVFTEAAPMTLTPPRRGSGVEIVPALTVLQEGSRPDAAAPFAWTGLDPWSRAIRPSADLRWGATPSIGVGATINPDFSQVENDETPIALNQRFAFSFDEHRPFFLDGSGYLSDVVGTLYSRSIVDPAYAVKAYSQSDKYAIGVLNAYDRHPEASVNGGGTPGFDDMTGAGALSTVARVSRNVGDGGHAALMLSDKDVVRGGAVDAWSRLGGIDIDVPIGDWTVGTVDQISATGGGPDGPLVGINGGLSTSYTADTDFNAVLYGDTPGFRREVGFQTLSGESGLYAELGHTFEPKGAIDTVRPYVTIDGVREVPNAYCPLAARKADDDTAYTIGQDLQIGSGWISTSGGYERIDTGTDHVNGLYGYVGGGDTPGPAFSYNAGLGGGREYAWGACAPGTTAYANAGVTLRPSPWLRANVSWDGNAFTPDGSPRELSQRVYLKVSGQFTRTVGMRVIAEHVSFTGSAPALISSALLTVLKQPGTAIYAGYAEQTDLNAGKALDRTVFAKATVLLRP